MLLNKNEYETDILARTMYGEARNQGVDGLTAVACVVLNRLTVSVRKGKYWWGNTVDQICLKPYQFSCWNKDDPNYARIIKVDESDPVFFKCKKLARAILEIGTKDITNGATHYHTAAVSPSWAAKNKITARIGSHIFYRPAEVPDNI